MNLTGLTVRRWLIGLFVLALTCVLSDHVWSQPAKKQGKTDSVQRVSARAAAVPTRSTVKRASVSKTVQAAKKTVSDKKRRPAKTAPQKTQAAVQTLSVNADPYTAQSSLQQVRQEIKVLSQQVNKHKQEYQTATKVLQQSEEAVAASSRSLQKLQTEYQSTKKSLATLRAALRRTDLSIQQFQQALGALFRQQYMQNRRSVYAAPVSVSAWDTVAGSRDARYLTYIARAQSVHMQRLKKEEEKNIRLVRAREGVVETLDQSRVKEQKNQQILKAKLEERQKTVESLSQALSTKQTQLSALKRDEAKLTNLIKQINQRIAEQEKARQKKLAEERAAAAQRQNETKAASAGSADNAYGNVPFETQKGRLSYPVVGHLMNQFGAVRSDTGSRWKGVFIQAPAGAMIRTLAPGRVVFSGWMNGYGNLLIVDHGQGYLSIYGHNEALLRKVGDAVKIGDAVATVGNSGGVKNFGLYLELRHRDRPIDPVEWMQKR